MNIQAKKSDNNKKFILSLGSLCDKLSKANIKIYHYENLKHFGRQKGNTSQEIDEWDKLSRNYCEARSRIKNEIDQLLALEIKQFGANQHKKQVLESFPYIVFPISLMIDVLTIENIKIYDLKKKKDIKGVEMAKSRRNAVKKLIDYSLLSILKTDNYSPNPEARTF